MNGASALRTAPDGDARGPLEWSFAGQLFEPMPSGALYWRAENALLVADLHLEKLSSYARRGSLLPPYDTGLTLRRLESDLDRTGAAEVIALGDSFHRDEGNSTLVPADRARLAALTRRARWTWISGNHDPLPHRLAGNCVAAHERRGLTFIHEPRPGATGLVAGHLHPAAHIAVNGRSVCRPCFVHDRRTMLLPAYGSATGSLNILGPAFAGLFDWSRIEVVMIGRGKVYPVNPKRLVAGRDRY